jgi:uncharacterized integral membrane protein
MKKNVVILSCLVVVITCLITVFFLHGNNIYRDECIYLIGLCELSVITVLFLAFVKGIK